MSVKGFSRHRAINGHMIDTGRAVRKSDLSLKTRPRLFGLDGKGTCSKQTMRHCGVFLAQIRPLLRLPIQPTLQLSHTSHGE
jgi:hypothetical protein